MPIYEYKCAQCEHKLEMLQKMSEPAETICPECGQASLKKQISAVAFQLKGTGWYETDFKNKKPDPQKTEQTAKSESNKTDSASNTTDSKKTDGQSANNSKPSKKVSGDQAPSSTTATNSK